MSFSNRDINAARAIVSTHETYPPKARPNYAQLAVLPDGPNRALQVTFGAHQATDRADSLDAILREYRSLTQAAGIPDVDTLSDELLAYLPRLAKNTPQSCADLATDATFKALLKRSAADPYMQEAQNEVFDVHYMQPAIAAMEGSGWTEPLSLAVIYDSLIHGGWKMMRDATTASINEHGWISSYVATRQFHLAHAGSPNSKFDNPLLRATIYRMATFRNLIGLNNWSLDTPFIAHGVTVTEDDISAWG